jgi:predicted protein tyrosine phosphatase
MFTCPANVVVQFLLAHQEDNVLLISIMVPPPEAIFEAVVEYGAQHIVIAAEDDEDMATTMATAVATHGDTIAAHHEAAEHAVTLIHCRMGRSRSTMFHALYLWRQMPEASVKQIADMVTAGRLAPNAGVPWKPNDVAIHYMRGLEWARTHRVQPPLPMTWAFGEDVSVQARFVRAMERRHAH